VRDGDDVAERGDAAGVGAPLIERATTGGGPSNSTRPSMSSAR
jgi:hypothetical protein